MISFYKISLRVVISFLTVEISIIIHINKKQKQQKSGKFGSRNDQLGYFVICVGSLQ